MATYTNQILVYVNGRNQKITSADDLVIGGSFTATSFSGDGSALTALNASNVSSGTLADARLSANVALYDAAAPTFTNTVSAAGFSGSGASLTSLNASSLSSGTVADARLSANVALLDAASNAFTGSLSASSFSGDGSSLTSLSASNVSSGTLADARLSANVAKYDDAAPTFTNTVSAAGFSGSGASLTSLDASNVSSGTLADARLSANVALLDAASNTFTGSVTATSFSGSAVGLTGIPAEHVTGAGLLPDGVLSSNVAKYDDADPTFTNNVTANAFVGDGGALSNLNAGNITGGTLADARLSSNVPLKNAASNTFDGTLNVGGNLNVTGNIVSAGATSVIVKDNFLDLNAGNTVFGTQFGGGLAINVECLSASAFTATDFVAGVASTSNPTVTVSGDASGLANGDLIQISGSEDATNDGQYVVESTSGSGPTVITVKGVGTTPTNLALTPFAHNQFTDQTLQTASLVKIRVTALSATNGVLADASGAFPVGGFCYASGSSESDFVDGWTNMDPAAAATLQNVYDNSVIGAIRTTAAKGGFTVDPADGESTGFDIVAVGAGQFGTVRATGGSDLLLQSYGGGNSTVHSDNTTILSAGTNIQINGPMTNAGANAGTLAQYTLVAYDSTGDLVAADADTADVVPVGIVYDDNNIYSSAGMRMKALGAAGTSWLPGATLYLAAEAGKVTDVPPASGRVYVVGVATDAYTEGVDATAWIRWAPQYIADL